MPIAKRTPRGILAIAFTVALAPLDAQPSRLGIEATAAGSRVISPAVVETWFATKKPPADSQLVLLVLWRGAPGWFLGGDRSGSATWVGDTVEQQPRTQYRVVRHRSIFGGRTLNVEFDPTARVVQVQNTELALNDDNVVLVDHVDVVTISPAIETRRLGGR